MRTTKFCSRCKKDKLFVKFGKNQKTGRYQSFCRKCNAEYLKIWYSKNKSKHKSNMRVRKKALKNEKVKYIVKFLLKNPCSKCNEKDPLVLDFDHLDGNIKFSNIGHMIMDGYSLESLKKEIEKCQVLCANCHRRKTAREGNHERYRVLQELAL